METLAHRSIKELDYEVNFWRTKTGLEVDFVLGGGEVAIEIKSSNRVDQKELRPLKAFKDEYKPKRTLLVCNENTERVVGQIQIIPWRIFLDNLWAGKIIG